MRAGRATRRRSVCWPTITSMMRRSLRRSWRARRAVRVVARGGRPRGGDQPGAGSPAGRAGARPGMRDGSSFETICRLHEQAPETQVVVVTAQDDPAFVRRALTAGALGFVVKDNADRELPQAVERLSGAAVREPACGGSVGRGRPGAHPAQADAARGGGPAPDRAGAHERRDGPQLASPRARLRPTVPYPQEARALLAGGARPLRARRGLLGG